MPFTFSHPAAILPVTLLPKKYYSLTGLIAGSVAPDFEYFIRVSINSEYSHTIGGVLWFNLPLGLMLAWIYHEIVKEPFTDSLPRFFRSRLEPFNAFKWLNYLKNNLLIVIFSIIIGAFSHLLWDSFTHAEGYFAKAIPFLSRDYNISGFVQSGFHIAQHTSTIIGGFVLLVYIYKLPVKDEISETNFTIYWPVVMLITLSAILLKVSIGIDRHFVNNIIIAGMSGSMLALVITPFLLKGLVKIRNK